MFIDSLDTDPLFMETLRLNEPPGPTGLALPSSIVVIVKENDRLILPLR
jgi:hypothetical protein